MKVIVIAVVVFLALVFGAMHFASRIIDEKEKDERTQSCAIDFIEGAQPGTPPAVKDGQPLRILGWAADVLRGRIPTTVDVLLIDGDRNEVVLGKGKPEVQRPDVAAMYKNPALTRAGFDIATTVLVPRQGDWELRIREHFRDRDIICYADKILRVAK